MVLTNYPLGGEILAMIRRYLETRITDSLFINDEIPLRPL